MDRHQMASSLSLPTINHVQFAEKVFFVVDSSSSTTTDSLGGSFDSAMAKSMRSKWKRKMRAIKRVGMDEKVLQRMKKMLADHEKEEKEEAQWKAQQQQAQNKDAIVIDVTPNEPPKPAGTTLFLVSSPADTPASAGDVHIN